MFFQYSTEEFNIPPNLLKRFVASCHWAYFRKYDLFGHHNCGWGFAYIPENSKKLIIKRDFNPIYRADWKSLSKLKSKFFLVHVRKTVLPWEKSIEDIHPININEKYVMTHNGIIKKDSFPDLKDSKLQSIIKKTDMDTRKYLCLIIDELKQKLNIKKAIQSALKQIEVKTTANAFLFNSHECIIIKYQNNTFHGRHTTLFLTKEKNKILVSTTPLSSKAKEIPNKSLIQIDLSNIKIKFSKLEI